MFPRSKMWDVMDATAYIVEVLELDQHYFDPPDIGGDIEAEYEELEYDSPLEFSRYV